MEQGIQVATAAQILAWMFTRPCQDMQPGFFLSDELLKPDVVFGSYVVMANLDDNSRFTSFITPFNHEQLDTLLPERVNTTDPGGVGRDETRAGRQRLRFGVWGILWTS